MRVLDVGQTVFLMRFLPDGQRLVIGTMDADRIVTFEVLSVTDGRRVRLEVPAARIDHWWYESRHGNVIAVHPRGDVCYLAWAGRLHACQTADDRPVPEPPAAGANQVVLSADGTRLVVANRDPIDSKLFATETGSGGEAPKWHQTGLVGFTTVAGFLPDGERFVTVEGLVRIRLFATGAELAESRVQPHGVQQPQISPDGRYLGMIGYGSMDFWDLPCLDKPRKISGTSNFGDFRSFAFHPNGKTVAVIYGGPTLVKVYDLATLKLVHTWNWKLGPLRSVAYSPDGTVGAAGSEDGRIVVWDVDE
jgi:WD40 repeat protein